MDYQKFLIWNLASNSKRPTGSRSRNSQNELHFEASTCPSQCLWNGQRLCRINYNDPSKTWKIFVLWEGNYENVALFKYISPAFSLWYNSWEASAIRLYKLFTQLYYPYFQLYLSFFSTHKSTWGNEAGNTEPFYRRDFGGREMLNQLSSFVAPSIIFVPP